MNVFDFPPSGASVDEIIAAKHRVWDYILNARDPNEAGDNGRTLLLLALMMCYGGKGESLVSDLLERGADPNRPSAWANFTLLLTVSNSLPLVRKLIDSGLKLNEVHEVDPEQRGLGLTTGPSTLLDHAYAIRGYISPKRKKLNALANKHAGGLGKRRRFIDETIALLESRGAKRAQEFPQT
jgi:hypothetical protein